MSLVHFNFESQFLHMNTDVNIILPDRPRSEDAESYYLSGKKYKVLWLLHGGMGDYSDWIRKSRIELYACEHDLVVVMPSAYNSSYSNWYNYAQGVEMFDYFFRELMPLVYGWFPVSQAREDNFLAGLSMGGQGTVKFTLAHPEKFGAVAVLSSAPRQYPKFYEDSVKNGTGHMFVNMVQAQGGIEKFMQGRDDARRVLAKLKDEGKLDDFPRIYASIGGDDAGCENFVEFMQICVDCGLDVTQKIIPGYRHEWRFWDLAIQDSLAFFGFDMERDIALRRGNMY